MRWHDTGRTKDGKLRHPVDGLAWSAFNDQYSQSASDPRSVRLGLASDGFNPFGTMSTSHSTWTVLLIPYNLPPWICMKRQSFILSSIIPEEKALGNDIDLSGIRFKYGKSKKRTREEDVGSISTHAKEATHDNEGAFECTNTIIEEDIDGENRFDGTRRFSIPQGESVDKVLSTMLSRKRRTVKYRLKMSLYQQAANKLNEANGINRFDAQEKTYTEDELLSALDLLEPPENFLEHQWRVYKSHLRKPIAKKVDNKREPNDFESFHLCYKTKDGTYLQEATRDMMVKELVGPEGIAEDVMVAKIAREVLNKLLGNEEPHCYGAGVTKSQISKFCCDLKRMRGEGLADENRFLKEKVDNQTKEIHTHKKQLEMCNKELETCKKQLASQNKKVESYKKQVETQGLQIKNMEQKLNEVYGMLKLLPAFPDLDNVASTSAAGTCEQRREISIVHRVIKAVKCTETIVPSFKHSFYLKVSNGRNVSFWHDPWCGNGFCLKNLFPRLFALDVYQDCKITDRWQFIDGFWKGVWNWRCPPRGRAIDDINNLVSMMSNLTLYDATSDNWSWCLDDSSSFKVSTLLNIVQNIYLADANLGPHHKWNSWIPRKVNICVWRASLNRLPSRLNLLARGVPIASASCPLCNNFDEGLDHCLISCPHVSPIWRKVWSWWHLPPPVSFPSFSVLDIALGNIDTYQCLKLKKIINGVFQVSIWAI
ncbi:ribose 5-phosphate isomerase A [Tanacetum coccineum]